MDTHDQAKIVEDAKQEQLRIRKAAYEQWLNHPTTREYLKVLATHESLLIDSLDETSRTLASVRTVRTIRKILLNFEEFNHKFQLSNQ